MLDQPSFYLRWPTFCLLTATTVLLLTTTSSAHAQFRAERAIVESKSSQDYGSFRFQVNSERQPTTCDVVLFGYHNRRPGRFASLQDTVLQIVPHRHHTLIGHKQGFMFHAESFWPDLLRERAVNIKLRPLAVGMKTDILGIHFIGNQYRIHPKSFTIADELLTWLQANPTVEINIIGHVNGADGRRSRAFYRKASVKRSKALIQWLVAKGVNPDRLHPAGYGSDALLFPDPVYAWQHEANRRVEIEVLAY